MRKMSLKTVRKIFHWVLGIGILLEIVAACADSAFLSIFTIVLLFGDVIFHLIFYRCPSCGSHIDVRARGTYCPFCGEKIFEEEDF